MAQHNDRVHRRDPDDKDDEQDDNKVFNNKHTQPGSDHVNQGNWLTRAQNHAQPLANRLRRWRTKLDEGAILRKRITVLTLLGLMVLSLAAGKLMSPPAQVIETSMGVKKEFVSGDTIEMQKTGYDKDSHTARLDLQTSSPTGVVSPQDLSVSFTSMKQPNNKLPAPQLYMIPTVNNHFVVIIRNLYSGFGAMELLFHNRGDFPLAQYQNALSNDSNGANGADLQGSASSYSDDTHIGALRLADKDRSTLLSNSTDASVQDQQKSLMKNIQQNNRQLIVIKEGTMFDKSTQIPSTLNPRDISVNDLNTQVDKLKNQISEAENSIKQNDILLNKMQKQSSTLSKDATVDKHYQSEINGLNQNINNTKQTNADSQRNIDGYQRQLNGYEDQINQLKNDRISFSAPVKQSTNGFSSK